jgi:hypothetical protein
VTEGSCLVGWTRHSGLTPLSIAFEFRGDETSARVSYNCADCGSRRTQTRQVAESSSPWLESALPVQPRFTGNGSNRCPDSTAYAEFAQIVKPILTKAWERRGSPAKIALTRLGSFDDIYVSITVLQNDRKPVGQLGKLQPIDNRPDSGGWQAVANRRAGFHPAPH